MEVRQCRSPEERFLHKSLTVPISLSQEGVAARKYSAVCTRAIALALQSNMDFRHF
ncbi:MULTISPECIES: hypothetical protein [unclassified Microcoleus]|uniref:hypothetical protein n=1 Tax=unclassified Microcoleus TaxID=2642155 RepID=UPI0025DD0CB6|nr:MULTISPECIES: hypothetical protein [unclassified Microcoleus]